MKLPKEYVCIISLFMQMLTTTLTSHNIPASQTQMIIAVIIVLAVYLQRSTRTAS